MTRQRDALHALDIAEGIRGNHARHQRRSDKMGHIIIEPRKLEEAATEAAREAAHEAAKEAADETAKEAGKEAYDEAYKEAYDEAYKEAFDEAYDEALAALPEEGSEQ
jgi:hypothetical protein